MGDAEDALAPSKKRAAGRELNRDKLDLDDEEETNEVETGTFKRASEDVLATRRIVKVRRSNNPSTAPQPSRNPFAGIRLVPPSDPVVPQEGQATASETEGTEKPESEPTESETGPAAEKDKNAAEVGTDVEKVEVGKVIEQTESQSKGAEAEVRSEPQGVGSETKEVEAESAVQENSTDNKESGDLKEGTKSSADDEKAESEFQKDEENIDSAAGGTSLNSFQQLSSTKNAFTGLAGTGFSGSAFSFGSISSEGSASLFGSKTDQPSFNFGLAGNGNSSGFGSSGNPIIPKDEGSKFPSKEEVVVETGEENEKVVFTADSILFEFTDGGWKERGKGEIKVNVSTSGADKARIVMRTKGNLRLVMNASLYPEIKLTNMDKKGITFACVNSISEGNSGLSTFALKFKDVSIVESFREAVEAHKGGREALKTPENSPKASEEQEAV